MFLAHKNELSANKYKVIKQLDSKMVLVDDGVKKLVSNICPHQGSIISSSDGVGKRTCPYHSWSFDISGNPLTSGRTSYYCKNKTPLDTIETYEFNNLLFTKSIFSKSFEKINLSNMMLKEYRVDTVYSSTENIMNLFLDVDHIETVHRGVYDQIGLSNINSVDWTYYDWGSLQIVKDKGSIGAAWLAIYPSTMIEWQPGALFITEAISEKDFSRVHVFKYSDNEQVWDLNNRVWETAWQQDRAQAERIVSSSDYNNLEESKKHFRNWIKNN
jgi:phenylpropionate dioxygenase-like ring-hydroxylating dioxygenase large terminal subunit